MVLSTTAKKRGLKSPGLGNGVRRPPFRPQQQATTTRCGLSRSGSQRKRGALALPFSCFQTSDVTPGQVTDSSGGAQRGRDPPHWRQEVSRRGDQKAAGCPGCLPVGGPVRRHSSDWPTCWDFRSRVSLWWCDVRPRGHDGERGDASAASPTSPPALEPSPGPSREPSPLELGGAPPPAVARTPVPPPPADWRAARRDRSPPGG